MPRLKALLPEGFRIFLRNVRLLSRLDLHQLEWRLFMIDKTQGGLSKLMQSDGTWSALMPSVAPRAPLNKHEYKIFSQNGEDGILLWLISQVGAPTRSFVEFGIGSGRECNSANLVLNFGWHGLMMDGSKHNVKAARSFFKYLMPWLEFAKLDIRQAFVTRENINDLIRSSTAAAHADLLSIDIDGNDYWVWEAITCIEPRIVVMEYNASFGAEKSVSLPYKADFDTYAEDGSGLYHGASLAALVKLGREKGYRFVGCDSYGVNAFFVKEEFAGTLKALSAVEAYYEGQTKAKRGTQAMQFELIKDKPLVEI